MNTLTANQIDILRALKKKRGPSLARISQQMAANTLILKGFIVETAHSYRITDAGKAALDAVTPNKPPAEHKDPAP